MAGASISRTRSSGGCFRSLLCCFTDNDVDLEMQEVLPQIMFVLAPFDGEIYKPARMVSRRNEGPHSEFVTVRYFHLGDYRIVRRDTLISNHNDLKGLVVLYRNVEGLTSGVITTILSKTADNVPHELRCYNEYLQRTDTILIDEICALEYGEADKLVGTERVELSLQSRITVTGSSSEDELDQYFDTSF